MIISGHKYRNYPTKQRFWVRVTKDGPLHPNYGKCWQWLGKPTGNGYGTITIDGKRTGTHRYSYQIHVGEIPQDLEVCHHCDNPLCVNPEHLFLGTKKANQLDKVSKGRQAKGETDGNSVLTEAEVREIRYLYRPGSSTYGLEALAITFNVSRATIHLVVTRKTWKHVE